MKKKPEIYEKWVSDGKLEKIIDFIKECSTALVSQKEICRSLGISENAFIQMKKKHKDIKDAIDESRIDLKKNLVNAIYKRAVGYETVDEDTIIEDAGKGKEPKRKITRTKKQVAPDTRSAIYLLTKHFGRDFSEKKDELEIMEKRLDNKEEWNDESTNNESK